MRLNFSYRVLFTFLAILAGALVSVRAAESKPLWKQIEDDLARWIVLPEPELRRKAEGGDPLAQYFYVIQTRVERPEDPARWETANRFFANAVKAGVPHALLEAAELAQVREPEKYPDLIEKAAETGLPAALHLLGTELYRGERVEVDEVRALELMRRAADAGHPKARAELGQLYAMGIGEPRHPGETPQELYRKASAQGEGEAMLELGRRYRLGYLVEQDVMEATRWYWKAAQQGSSPVRPFLNEQLEPLGTGRPEDRRFSEFYSLYAQAQVKREPEPMRKLGEAFLNGEYGEPNAVTGYFWLRYAARKGDSAAAKLASTAKANLRPEQVSEVEQELDASQAAERAAEEARRQQQLRR